jgi:hypothetical protein
VAIAHADDTDAQFLAALRSEGISDHMSPAHAIEAGHMVCQKLDQGLPPADVANDVLNSSVLPVWHAGYLVGVSVKDYCPQHASKVSDMTKAGAS